MINIGMLIFRIIIVILACFCAYRCAEPFFQSYKETHEFSDIILAVIIVLIVAISIIVLIGFMTAVILL